MQEKDLHVVRYGTSQRQCSTIWHPTASSGVRSHQSRLARTEVAGPRVSLLGRAAHRFQHFARVAGFMKDGR